MGAKRDQQPGSEVTSRGEGAHVALQVVWGISCGVGEVDVDGTVCQEFKTQTADGYVCTCNTSWCNSIDQVKDPQYLLTNTETAL